MNLKKLLRKKQKSQLKVFSHLFLKTHSFSEALEALKQGKKIRRKTERKGFFKSPEGNFKAFWVGEQTTTSHCLLTFEDILADDWIIDT